MGPRIRRASEQVGAARAVAVRDISTTRPDQSSHASGVEGDRPAKEIAGRTVSGGELLLMRPRVVRFHEHVHAAAQVPVRIIIAIRADEGSRAGPIQRDCGAEQVAGIAILNSEFLLVRPCVVRFREHVGAARRITSCPIVSERPDKGGRAGRIKCSRATELIMRVTIDRGELLGLCVGASSVLSLGAITYETEWRTIDQPNPTDHGRTRDDRLK
jgi:hypothetical protein